MKRGDGGESFNFLPLPFEFIHCRGESAALAAKCAGRSAGPEVGRGGSTPPSLPLDSTHPTTRKGLLAPFRPQSSCRSGKMLAASLKAFFALLRFESPSAAAAAAPRRGAGAPSPSAPVGRIHLSQRERQEALPVCPWCPFKKEARSVPTTVLALPLGVLPVLSAGANAPAGSQRQQMTFAVTAPPVKKQRGKSRRIFLFAN